MNRESILNTNSAKSGFSYRIITMLFILFIGAGFSQAKEQVDSYSSDGGRYYGPLVDGKRHGSGRLEWNNGTSYEGGFSNGLFSGKGRLKLPSGELYEGDFKNGMLDGHGKVVHPDGSIYIGEFRNDVLHGQGRLQTLDGYVYKGSFAKGQQTGQGSLTGPESEYVGHFLNGQFSGSGKLKHSDGSQYEGNFTQNLYHGKGRFTNRAGDIYEGNFVKGQFTGNGTYSNPAEGSYEGSFVNWVPEGKGAFTDPEGNVYEGKFKHGKLGGKGRMVGKDGSRYEGDFMHSQFHGRGKLKNKDGDVYEGNFAYGMFDGKGTYRYAKPQKDGSTLKKGTWQYGEFLDKEAEKQQKTRIENALYSQSSLLSSALEQLKPQDPSRIDLYLLAVGGDGSQEVFRRETEFVKTQFDRDFGTLGRSLILANSREASSRLPMATATSIQKSLQSIASKMDKQNDILFLFMTSHGSKEHEFVLGQGGMDIANLEADRLGSLLKESGIRWKVIVVSACYSGGFIDALKDRHTLIITAARHDRTSFGCADENDFTYFGKAYFHDALPVEKSFVSAFGTSKILIKNREREDFAKGGEGKDNKHSEPQIYSPAPIIRHLHRWEDERKRAGAGVLNTAYAK